MATEIPQPYITKYRCPFHPEIVSTEEKRCYKCGMKLEPFKSQPKS